MNRFTWTCRACVNALEQWYPQCPICGKLGAIRPVESAPAPLISMPGVSITDADPSTVSQYRAAVNVPPACDGEHAGPACGDAECWHRDDVTPLPASLRTAIEPVRITDVPEDDYERTPTGIDAFDCVLGGGLVASSVVLIGGLPGAGKSSLINQAIHGAERRSLYLSGEETIGQVAMRARRISATAPEIWIVPCNDLDDAIRYIDLLRPSIVVVDSIQKIAARDVSGHQGSISQIKECTSRLVDYAKTNGVIVILIGHVTKDGALSGPQTLEHLVDVTMTLEVSEEIRSERILRAHKNRFGDTTKLGFLTMTAEGLQSNESHRGDAATPAPEVSTDPDGQASDRSDDSAA